MAEDREDNGRRKIQGDGQAWTFFRQWLKNPFTIAAVSPSSRELAHRMLRELPEGTQRVIELGGGTGVFTQALIERGIAAERLLVVELNQTLYQHLRERFPQANVVCADARDLHEVAQRVGFLDDGPADAVISGLGLLSMSKSTQRAILESAFAAMGPHGRFIQFTYGPTIPVAREVVRDLDLSAQRTGFTLWNVPPAAVYVFSRNKSRRVPSRPR